MATATIMEIEFDQGDEKVQAKSNLLQFEKGPIYRLSFPWLSEKKTSPRFLAAKRFWVDKVGRVIYGGPEFNAFCNGKVPKEPHVITIVVNWPLNSKGQVDPTRVKERDFQVVPWLFSADKYRQIVAIHREFSLVDHDLKVECTDKQFQKLNPTATQDGLYAKLALQESSKDLAAWIDEQVAEIVPTLSDHLGATLSVAELQQRLASLAGAQPQTGGRTAASGFRAPVVDTSDVDAALANLA